jgi:hypothetical protein
MVTTRNGQSHAGMSDENLAVTGWRHATGMPLEELHIEAAFDLAQELGGGRLSEIRSCGGSRQSKFFIEANEERQLACLQR